MKWTHVLISILFVCLSFPTGLANQCIRDSQDQASTSPISAEQFSGYGYVSETLGVYKNAPHTLEDPIGYAKKYLGDAIFKAAKYSNAKFIIAIGPVKNVKKELSSLGWELLAEIDKSEGMHRIFKIKRSNGREGYVILRVNTSERLVHFQSLLKYLGVDAHRVQTIGKCYSWSEEMARQLNKFDAKNVDGVFYGFSNSILDSLLHLLPENMHFRPRLEEVYSLRHKPIGIDENEMSNMWITELRFKDGRRYLFVPNLYGTTARYFFDAAKAAKIRKFFFLGTAGGTDPQLRVGMALTPRSMLSSEGNIVPLNWIKPVSGSRSFGRYHKVPSFFIETQNWLHDKMQKNVSIVEVEFEHAIKTFNESSGVDFSSSLIVSDVLVGPNSRDIRSFSDDSKGALVPFFKSMLEKEIAGSKVVDSFKYFPMVAH